ncbi:CHAT domain-containing protein [Streptomyces sp. V3I7]|uniref:CHAT domain-containing protein n=1 Tax=Streptomyces sp. V3I7 TaxID=3042278 RepID=UPI00277FF410|nr:CHAT domain-containing protein [Streptomyces sp. V3I7]MDQ0989626.1 hypothetical protein [Streptomyces sp. V3I7]
MGDRCDKGDRMRRRDELLTLLGEILRRISDKGDPTLASQAPVQSLAAELTATIDESEQWDLDARHALGWLTWYQYEASRGHDRRAAKAALDLLTPGAITIGMREFPAPLLPALVDRVAPRSAALLQHAAAGSDVGLLCNLVDHWIHLVNATPKDNPDRPRRLTVLCGALQTRFARTGNERDLNDAVTAGRWAVESGADHPDLGMYLSNLGAALKAVHEHTHDAADLDEAVRVLRRAVTAAAGHPQQEFALTNLGAVLQARFDLTHAGADLDEAMTVTRRALDAMPADHPERGAVLSNLGHNLRIRYEQTGDPAELDEAVRIGRASVAAGAQHPDRGLYLSTLGRTLRSRHQRTQDAADLDETVDVLRRAVEATPDRHTERGQRLAYLGDALESRAGLTDTATDLDETVDVLRQAVAATPADDREHPLRLLNLSRALETRCARAGDPADGDEASAVASRAVERAEALDHPARALTLSNLGSSLLARYERTGEAADLDAAVSAGRRAVESGAADAFDRLLHLTVLDAALWRRFQLRATDEDLDEVLATRRLIIEATQVGDAERGPRLEHLVTALVSRYTRQERLADLDESIALGRLSLDAAADDSGRSTALVNLAGSLHLRFDRLRERADLDEAVTLLRRAAEAPVAPLGGRGLPLANLAQMLRERARGTGSLQDLDEATAFARRAVEETALPPADGSEGDVRTRFVLTLNTRRHHSGKPAEADSSRSSDHADAWDLLAECLMSRFTRTGSLADVEDAVEVRRRAVEATAPEHEDRAKRLSALSFALRSRFERGGAGADIDASIDAARQAVAVAHADDPQRAVYIASLSNALHFRYRLAGDRGDLDEGVRIGRLAVEIEPQDEALRAHGLTNLCNLLQHRFDVSRDPRDLDEAVDVGRRALDVAPAPDVTRPKALMVLATAVRSRFQRGEDLADKDEGLRHLTELVRCVTAPAALRNFGARLGSDMAFADDPALAAELLETVVLLLPELASHRLRRGDQQFALGSAADLADSAAAAALADPTRPLAERAQRALTLLETGRAVLLSQALDARGDLTELRGVHPDLAARFTALRERLDRDVEPPQAASAGQRSLRERADTAAEMTALLGHIRTLDGFAGFALPPTLDELAAEAGAGPIVTFTVHEYGSHALLLTPGEVTVLPLPGLTPRVVIDKVNAFHVALRDATDPDADRVAAQNALGDVLAWLWDTVTGPVLDRLGHRTTPDDQAEWPRLWWAPNGRLSLLPLHAAGHHGDPGTDGRRTVMDRVVSSYTPTVRALRQARRRRSAGAARADRSLVVAMPTTPGLPDHGRLQHVTAEQEMLAGLLPDPLTLTEPDPGTAPGPGPLPTRDLVLAELPGRPVVHFACHGEYDLDDPATSRLLLHDHAQSPLTVASLVGVNLEDAQLAYLSACHTALNVADRFLDEAMHLAGAFQLAGFPQVVGTLWTLDDEVAVDIAEDFYTALRDPDSGTLDLGRAAHALHRATRTQRDRYPGTPSLWAAHLYTGA